MITTLPPILPGILRRFVREQDGISAVEFAMILPLMITLYLGCIEVTKAVSADRKTTLVAHTVGDLVAQTNCVTSAELTNVYDAAKAVLSPYDGAELAVVVSSILIDANKNATVAWSEPFNGATAHQNGDTSKIPDTLKVASTSLIWAEAKYVYKPIFATVITGPKTLTDQIFLRPRLSSTVVRKASCP